MLKSIKIFFKDFLIYILPFNFLRRDEYRYGFLVHPRNLKDVSRKFFFFKYLPKKIQHLILKHFCPPVKVSEITGLKSMKDGRNIKGFIFSIPLLPEMMRQDRDLALKKIIKAVKFAKKNGVKIMSLGGQTSSYSKSGLEIINKIKDIYITTGHAYTSYNVTKNLFKVVDLLNLDKKNILVAVVGAAGSIGSASAKLVAREGFSNILLVDLPKKISFFADLTQEMKALNPFANITTSHQVHDIINADLIITATSAPEAMIRDEDLKRGAIVFDDAQPADVSPEVLKNGTVLVLEAGVVKTPNIHSHFNFNLKDKDDNFSCMAEVLILASNEWKGNYAINRTKLEQVDKISAMGNELGFRLADFQNFNEKISNDRILKMKELIGK